MIYTDEEIAINHLEAALERFYVQRDYVGAITLAIASTAYCDAIVQRKEENGESDGEHSDESGLSVGVDLNASFVSINRQVAFSVIERALGKCRELESFVPSTHSVRFDMSPMTKQT